VAPNWIIQTREPTTDIYETDQALTVVMEMPVGKTNLEINVENDVLSVTGSIDFSKYETLQPVYTEYNIGHYCRIRRGLGFRADPRAWCVSPCWV
jgi:HSP20 family molecular chaperone IbpA